MTIVDIDAVQVDIHAAPIRAGRVRYSLHASFRESGDLVLEGFDRSASVQATFETDQYEYAYVVNADQIMDVCAALGTDRGTLLEGIRDHLAPHGYTASSVWKAWLIAHGIPYELIVQR